MDVVTDETYPLVTCDLFLDTDGLVVGFGEKTIEMEFNNPEEVTLVKTLLESPDFWASFLGSLSAALGRHQ
jgi:hypothetical protein